MKKRLTYCHKIATTLLGIKSKNGKDNERVKRSDRSR